MRPPTARRWITTSLLGALLVLSSRADAAGGTWTELPAPTDDITWRPPRGRFAQDGDHVVFLGHELNGREVTSYRHDGSAWIAGATFAFTGSSFAWSTFHEARREWVILHVEPFGPSLGIRGGLTGPFSSFEAAPAYRVHPAFAYDRSAGAALLFGGDGLVSGCDPCADTWRYDGAFEKQSPAHSPPERDHAALVSVPGTGLLLIGGGAYGDAAAAIADVWRWDGKDWAIFPTDPPVPVSLWTFAGYDEGTGKVVAHFTGVGGEYAGPDELWELSGAKWTKDPAAAPRLDEHSSMAYDRSTGGFYVGAALPGDSLSPVYRYRHARERGEACLTDAGCATGHCASGVCCDVACNGSCQACSVALGSPADGTCGLAAVRSRGAPSCAPFLCDGQSGACPSACASDDACETGSACRGGICVASAACTDDGLSLRATDTRSCAPYRCRDAACLAVCASGDDCAPGAVCGADGRCTNFPPAPRGEDGCGLVGRASNGGWALGLLVPLALARRRRRPGVP